jgi:hypothetical protein
MRTSNRNDLHAFSHLPLKSPVFLLQVAKLHYAVSDCGERSVSGIINVCSTISLHSSSKDLCSAQVLDLFVHHDPVSLEVLRHV